MEVYPPSGLGGNQGAKRKYLYVSEILQIGVLKKKAFIRTVTYCWTLHEFPQKMNQKIMHHSLRPPHGFPVALKNESNVISK